MSRLFVPLTFLTAITTLALACTQPSAGPTAPAAALNPDGGQSANGEQPPFNLEAILRGDGFGLVKFRQERDPSRNIVTLDTFVRDLLPNTSYSLQRWTPCSTASARARAVGSLLARG